jgi:hypothetical protein
LGRSLFRSEALEVVGRQQAARRPILLVEKGGRLPHRDLDETPSIQGAGDGGPNNSKLWNHDAGIPIRSGDVISLRTDDPQQRPLPDVSILEMQWYLHQVVTMSGAAEELDLDGNFRDDEDDFTGASGKKPATYIPLRMALEGVTPSETSMADLVCNFRQMLRGGGGEPGVGGHDSGEEATFEPDDSEEEEGVTFYGPEDFEEDGSQG